MQTESCEALKGLVMTTEIKEKLLQTGMTRTLLDLSESVYEIPEADGLVQKIMELLQLVSARWQQRQCLAVNIGSCPGFTPSTLVTTKRLIIPPV